MSEKRDNAYYTDLLVGKKIKSVAFDETTYSGDTEFNLELEDGTKLTLIPYHSDYISASVEFK